MLCILSATGTLVYATFDGVSVLGSTDYTSAALALYSFAHFVLPMVIAYSIATNNPANRLLILGYLGVIGLLFLNEWQFPRVAGPPEPESIILVLIVFGGIALWLYRGRKTRYYFALIKHLPVPPDLLPYGDSLAGDAWLSKKLRTRANWIADHLESIVLIGFIVAVISAFLMI